MSMMRVRVVGTGWTGAPGLGTHNFRSDGDSEGDAQLCVARVRAAYDDAKALWPSGVSWQVQSEVDVVNETTGETISTWAPAAPAVVNGAGPDTSRLPIATALLVKYGTSTFLSGRRIQGRSFISPLYSQMGDGVGTPTEPARALGIAFGDALMDAGLTPLPFVVWRRPRAADPDATPPVTARDGALAVVTSVTVPDKFAVLRSRRD